MADSERINDAIKESADTVSSLSNKIDAISAISDAVVGALKNGNKVLTAGNGGSAAESLHFAEELVGRFRDDRPSLPSVSLVADSTALTCIGNDYGFDKVFSRQVEGLGEKGDVLILFSTSGNSKNLELALNASKDGGLETICILGRDGGSLAGKGDCEIIVEGSATERIQEAHQVILHIILDAVETAFSD